jgi:hypothetical protein
MVMTELVIKVLASFARNTAKLFNPSTPPKRDAAVRSFQSFQSRDALQLIVHVCGADFAHTDIVLLGNFGLPLFTSVGKS